MQTGRRPTALDNREVPRKGTERGYESRRDYSPEFHAGPKGKSTAKTCRMMGDWAASSSSLSSLSCTTGAHCSISVDCMRGMSVSLSQRADPRACAGGYVEDGRKGRLTSTVSGVFAGFETMLDTPAARPARRVRSTRRRRQRMRRECMVSSGGGGCLLEGGVAETSGGRAPTQTRSRSCTLSQAPVTWHNALTRRAPAARWWLHPSGARSPRVSCQSNPSTIQATCSNMYPTQSEQAVVNAAENLMTETMARYDPSHDAFHGTSVSVLYGHTIY